MTATCTLLSQNNFAADQGELLWHPSTADRCIHTAVQCVCHATDSVNKGTPDTHCLHKILGQGSD